MKVGLHEMDGLDKYNLKTRIFKDLDIFKNIELKRTPEFYKLLSAKGSLDFTMPDNTEQAIATLKEKDIAFLISDLGITPIMPMLKELEKIKTTRKVFRFFILKKHNLS